MSALGWFLLAVFCICLVLAIAYHFDAVEARHHARIQEQIRAWDANSRGSAKVVDFQEYVNQQNGKEAA